MRSAGLFLQNLNKKLGSEQLWLLLILFIAAFLRFYHYSAFSYSNDELSAINRLQFNTFSELVKGGFYVDGHPGGIQVFLWYWSKLFGITEASLRLPFVLSGILAVFFAFLVAKRMFSAVTGLFTSAAMAFLQFPLLYSQIARPYGSGMLFCLMMVWFWLKIVFNSPDSKEKASVTDYVWFTLATAFCMYNHYFSFLFAIIVGVSGLFFLNRKQTTPYVIAGFVACLLFLPHLPITLNHLTYKGVGLWLGKPSPFWPVQHIFYILNESVYTVLLFMTTAMLLAWKNKKANPNPSSVVLALCWFAIPLILGYFYSIWVNPVLQHSVLIFSFPFMIMLLFMKGGTEFGRMQQILLGIFIIAGLISTVFVNNYYRSQHFGEFKGIASNTIKWETEFGKDSITKVIVLNSPYYINHYLNRAGYSTQFDLYDLRTPDDLRMLGKIVNESPRPYFLYAWTKPAPAEADDIIRSEYPYISKNVHYGSLSEATLYSRYTGTEFEPEMGAIEVFRDTVSFDRPGDNRFDPAKTSRQFYISPPNSFLLDTLTEYSCGFEKDMSEFTNTEALMVVARISLLKEDSMTDAMLVISLESKDGKSVLWESALADYTTIPGKWSNVRHTARIQGRQCAGSKLKVYLWNKKHRKLYIDDLRLSIYHVSRHSPFSDDQRVWGNQ